MNMNKITLLKTQCIASLLAIFLFASCADDLMISVLKATMDGNPLPPSIEFSNAAGQAKIINIASTDVWSVLNYGSSTFPDWISVTPNKANGNANVVITLTKVNTLSSARSYTLTFVADSGEKITLKITQNGDVYATFKNDPTPRWESGATIQKNIETHYTFITDAGKKLIPTARYKTGRITQKNGSEYEILEFNTDATGKPYVKKQTNAQIRKQSGTTSLYSFEIVKVGANNYSPLLWIVFKETATSPERRIVQ